MKSINKTNYLLLLAVLLFIRAGPTVSQATQLDYEEKIEELVALPIPNAAQQIRRGLKTIGQPAIPILVKLLNGNNKISPPKKLFLVDLIEDIVDDSQNHLLVQLLENSSAQIRGRAVIFLASKKVELAVPKLIKLLDDEETYLMKVQTDPFRRKNTSVRSLVLSALARITNKTPRENVDENKQVEFWKDWWQRRFNGAFIKPIHRRVL